MSTGPGLEMRARAPGDGSLLRRSPLRDLNEGAPQRSDDNNGAPRSCGDAHVGSHQLHPRPHTLGPMTPDRSAP